MHLDAARSRPDIVRRPTPPGAVQRPPHQTGKCPRTNSLFKCRHFTTDRSVVSVLGKAQCSLNFIVLFSAGYGVVIVKNGQRICGTGAALANAPIVQNKAYFEAKLQSSGNIVMLLVVSCFLCNFFVCLFAFEEFHFHTVLEYILTGFKELFLVN